MPLAFFPMAFFEVTFSAFSKLAQEAKAPGREDAEGADTQLFHALWPHLPHTSKHLIFAVGPWALLGSCTSGQHSLAHECLHSTRAHVPLHITKALTLPVINLEMLQSHRFSKDKLVVELASTSVFMK